MTHLVPYPRQGLAGYALLDSFQGYRSREGLVRKFLPSDRSLPYWADVFADRSVLVGAWEGKVAGSGTGAADYPCALAFQGYLAPDNLQHADKARVDPSIAALISQASFWQEVADLCAQAPAVAATPEEASVQDALFPPWMPYDGQAHPGYEDAMRLCFAAARPFWQGPHTPTEVWVRSPAAPGDTVDRDTLRIAGMRSDGYPFSVDEMEGPFARAFRAVLEVQPFWPAHSRLFRTWQHTLLAHDTPSKVLRARVMEWRVPAVSAHAWLSLLSQHQGLVDHALAGLALHAMGTSLDVPA